MSATSPTGGARHFFFSLVFLRLVLGVLKYLVHGFMCDGIGEFHTGDNMRVSV